MNTVAYNELPYCPRRHITARQLRSIGFYVGENIPDEAYVRRIAVGLNADEEIDDGSATLGLRLLEPFIFTAVEEMAVA